MFSGVRCTRAAYQVLPISTRRWTGSMFMYVVMPTGTPSRSCTANGSIDPASRSARRRSISAAMRSVDALACIAVEFRTHRLNHQSRRAIERLGAQLDGILRNHQRATDGTLRDTAVYSITADEWPTVRSHLDWQLARPR